MRSKLHVIIIAFIAILFAAVVYLFFLSRNLKSEIIATDAEFDSAVLRGREVIKKDFDEKFRTDMASYEEAYKRLKTEKQKARSIENKIAKNGKVAVR